MVRAIRVLAVNKSFLLTLRKFNKRYTVSNSFAIHEDDVYFDEIRRKFPMSDTAILFKSLSDYDMFRYRKNKLKGNRVIYRHVNLRARVDYIAPLSKIYGGNMGKFKYKQGIPERSNNKTCSSFPI